jgi:hypothetical protein
MRRKAPSGAVYRSTYGRICHEFPNAEALKCDKRRHIGFET